MSTLFVVALIVLGLAVVAAGRRTAAVALVAVQSVALGVYAVASGVGESSSLAVAGVLLVGKGIVLPALLWWVVRRTQEPRLIAGERGAADPRDDRRRRHAGGRRADPAARPRRAMRPSRAPRRSWCSAS